MSRTRTHLNDEDRRQWVANDEGLYQWARAYRGSMRDFIRENRAELDRIILGLLHAAPPEKTWRDYCYR